MAKYGSFKFGLGVKYGQRIGIVGAPLPISTGNVAGKVEVKGTVNATLADLNATTAGQTVKRCTAVGQLAALTGAITGILGTGQVQIDAAGAQIVYESPAEIEVDEAGVQVAYDLVGNLAVDMVGVQVVFKSRDHLFGMFMVF